MRRVLLKHMDGFTLSTRIVLHIQKERERKKCTSKRRVFFKRFFFHKKCVWTVSFLCVSVCMILTPLGWLIIIKAPLMKNMFHHYILFTDTRTNKRRFYEKDHKSCVMWLLGIQLWLENMWNFIPNSSFFTKERK